jgi:hypothetical protein
MKTIAGLTAVLLIAVVTGCSTISVNQDYDPDFDFSGWHSFTFAPYETKMGIDEITYGEMKSAISKNLTAKGMTASDTNPDFVVSIASAKQRQTEITQTGPGWWGTDVYQYEEGTLLVDFFEAKDQKLVWRGTAKGELSDNPSQEEKQANINSVVSQLLAKFPPKSKS